MHISTIFVEVLVIIAFASAIAQKKPKNREKEPNSIENIYNLPPKTKECINREKAIAVINLYKSFRNLTKDLFAITRAEADDFRNLIPIHEEKRRPPVRPCKRRLPKFGECKFQEIAHLLNTTQCLPIRDQIRPADEEGSDDFTGNSDSDYSQDYDEDYSDDEDKRKRRNTKSRSRRSTDLSDSENNENTSLKRSRRALTTNQRINHADGSFSIIRGCVERKTLSENNHLRIIRECAATTTLPDNRFPRYLNEVLCDSTDQNCFQNEGVNIQRVVQIMFRKDEQRNLGVTRLGEWREYVQQIKTSCSCQIKQSSLFSGFL